jgi:capsular exopolysaccharide synthesis family protein
MVTDNSKDVSSLTVQRPNSSSDKSAFFNKEIDAEKIFHIVIKRWPIILLSTILGFFLSNIFLRYATPMYSASSKVLIKDTRTSGGMSESVIFQDLGILNSGRNLDNEIQILRTSYLMEEVVKRLNLQYSYTIQGRLKSSDLYGESAIRVLSWVPSDSSQEKSSFFEVSINANNQFSIIHNEKTYKGEFGQSIKFPSGNLTLGKSVIDSNSNKKVSDTKIIGISIYPITHVARQLSKNLNVSVDLKSKSTVLDLSITDVNPKKAVDIITGLIDVYNESEISDKNRIYKYTVNFIDERIKILRDELIDVEGNVASFQSETGAINLIGEGAILLTESNEGAKAIGLLEGQLQIIRAIKAQLQNGEQEFDFVPTSETLTNTALTGLLANFNELLLDRERLNGRLGPKNPEVLLVEKQLNNLRINIVENINNIERDLLVNKKVLTSQDRSIVNRIKKLPVTERQLLEIQRQQAIKQQLYLYLLQKREEAELSLSVTVANNRVIEPPKFNGQVSPNVKQVKLFSLSLGFLLPIIILLVLQAFNKKVMTEEHIGQNTITPILGTIPQTSEASHIAVGEKKRSAAAEMFRLVRANLQYVGEGVNNKVIAFTSSISGEGKSFITLNMGLTLALGTKKVVIIELDMRKPKVASYLGYQKGKVKGITDYLVDDSLDWPALINKSSQNENLFFIPCGPLPPNPSELLLSDKLQNLISILRKEFDYILIDTPPIGLVSDALLLNKIIDATFYIVRQGVTEQRQLKIVEDINKNRKLPRVYIVFNGIKFGSGGYGYGTGYGYGYGYNYGYGYGYYADDAKAKSFWKKLFKIK